MRVHCYHLITLRNIMTVKLYLSSPVCVCSCDLLRSWNGIETDGEEAEKIHKKKRIYLLNAYYIQALENYFIT